MGYSSSGERLFEIVNPALRSEVISLPIVPNLTRLSNAENLPVTVRGTLRAYDLIECGYPTEALLLAVAIFDATIQNSLSEGMQTIGIPEESATELLRNTTTSRFKTYLDPVLKLVFGQSLKQEHPLLFNRIMEVSRLRNDAIHNGKEVSRSEARDALICIYDILHFIGTLTPSAIELPPRPEFFNS